MLHFICRKMLNLLIVPIHHELGKKRIFVWNPLFESNRLSKVHPSDNCQNIQSIKSFWGWYKMILDGYNFFGVGTKSFLSGYKIFLQWVKNLFFCGGYKIFFGWVQNLFLVGTKSFLWWVQNLFWVGTKSFLSGYKIFLGVSTIHNISDQTCCRLYVRAI